MKKNQVLKAVALGVGGSAVAGFGLGFGRDTWKSAKKNRGALFLLALAGAALVLPFLGGRNLVRGYPRDSRTKAFWGITFGILLIVGGAAITLVLALVVFAVTTGSQSFTASSQSFLLDAVSGLVGFLAALGVLIGAFQRPTRRKKFAIEERNEAFLDKLGFAETGEQEITHYDGEGNPLRLLERAKDTVVFLAVGKRNKRAYIRLSPDGEMTGYTGVIPIDAPREYATP